MTATTAKAVDTRPNALRSVARSIEPLFPDAADTLRGIARSLAAELPCDITADSWCATHSIGAGPVYCGRDRP